MGNSPLIIHIESVKINNQQIKVSKKLIKILNKNIQIDLKDYFQVMESEIL